MLSTYNYCNVALESAMNASAESPLKLDMLAADPGGLHISTLLINRAGFLAHGHKRRSSTWETPGT